MKEISKIMKIISIFVKDCAILYPYSLTEGKEGAE